MIYNSNQNYTKNKRCPICNKLITNKSTKCQKCYFKNRNISGKNNPNYDNHPIFSKETKKKMSLARLGKKNSQYKDGRTLKQYYCKDCGKKISVLSGCYSGGRCLSCGQKENYKRNGQYGKIGTVNAGYFKNVFMKSGWEILFAQFLTLSNIKWKYEPQRFDLNNNCYIPDFYIIEWDLYIEIKGWWRPGYLEKIKMFRKKYPHEHLIILKNKELKRLGIL